MDWQPIETAPKDGTWVIVWGGKTDESTYLERVILKGDRSLGSDDLKQCKFIFGKRTIPLLVVDVDDPVERLPADNGTGNKGFCLIAVSPAFPETPVLLNVSYKDGPAVLGNETGDPFTYFYPVGVSHFEIDTPRCEDVEFFGFVQKHQ